MKFMQVIRKIFSAIFYTAEAVERSSKSLSNLAGIAEEQTANYALEIRAERKNIQLKLDNKETTESPFKDVA